MSSYYPSFNYKGKNSYTDKNLIVVHFESGDSGEVDTFLSMEPIYADNAYGTCRLDYGAKYTDVAVIRISVMKADGKDFTTSEVRDFLKWTTGARQVSYLDLVDDGDTVVVSFLGRITSVYQQKLDARTVGFVIEHTSVSPWGYSSINTYTTEVEQYMAVDGSGIVYKVDVDNPLQIDQDGTLFDEDIGSNRGPTSQGTSLEITDEGVAYLVADSNVRGGSELKISNATDDLYTPIYPEIIISNNNSTSFSMENLRTSEITEITGLSQGEVVTLSSSQFITSNMPGKNFARTFNFVWPRLLPGLNRFLITFDCEGTVDIKYRHPIKIGDCAIDVDVSDGGLCCGSGSNGSDEDTPQRVSWRDIIDLPSTIQ